MTRVPSGDRTRPGSIEIVSLEFVVHDHVLQCLDVLVTKALTAVA